MRPEATVGTEDLGKTLDWLEELTMLLYELHQERRGVEGGDPLIRQLSEELIDERGVWAPIRYQLAIGMGWSYLAEGVEGLRERLLERYSDAAL